jgi:hypothetical protein
MTDDNDRVLTLEELKVTLKMIKRDFDAKDARHNFLGNEIAYLQRETELSYRLDGMELPYEQEMLLYNLLRLPPEALALVKEYLGIIPKQE